MCIKINSLTYDEILKAVEKTVTSAETEITEDAKAALINAANSETNEISKKQLQMIIENINLAKQKQIPVCQDTGILIFYVTIGQDIKIDFDLESAIKEGVKIATNKVPLRPNVVNPLTRENTNTNIGFENPDIRYNFEKGNIFKIDLIVKGAGSENMSAIKMFKPTEQHLIPDFVVETVLNAGGNPCPPVILGIGIGGSFDKSASLAKKALTNPKFKPEDMSVLELKILNQVNSLGIGCMGLGGDTTAIGIAIEEADCHTASLPVAINVQCWADRRESAIYKEEV